jgi:hypothetical protein
MHKEFLTHKQYFSDYLMFFFQKSRKIRRNFALTWRVMWFTLAADEGRLWKHVRCINA